MVLYYILGGIAALVLILLTAKLRINVVYCQKLTATASYLFLKFDLTKFSEKPQTEEKTGEGVKKAAGDDEDEVSPPFRDTLGVVLETLKKLFRLLKKSLYVEKFDVRLTVSTPDVDKTACLYGAASASLAILTRFVLAMKCRASHKKNIRVRCDCDFIAEECDFLADIKLAAHGISCIKLLWLIFTTYRSINKLKPIKEKQNGKRDALKTNN